MCDCGDLFHTDMSGKTTVVPPTVSYHSASLDLTLDQVLAAAGCTKAHVVAAPGAPWALLAGCTAPVHHLPACATAEQEYAALFALASQLILQQADRQTLLVFAGGDPKYDGFAALLGCLPFRGLQTCLLTQREQYGDVFRATTPSGLFEYDATDAARMGKWPVPLMFGPLASRDFVGEPHAWAPMPSTAGVLLPFKIAGLEIPMILEAARYADAVAALADTVDTYYGAERVFPVVSCGETVHRLGYGQDVLSALERRGREGFYFAHRSGETYKRADEYGRPELLQALLGAKRRGLKPLVLAVGGGVNGNCIGLLAALVGADLVEVPTTPMHFNDATTSAKKAYSLVVDDKILSKNILGAFYLPKLVFCVQDCFLTLSTANVHAAVGEAAKTMNMLGCANSEAGAREYSNILGAQEFASDFTSILSHAPGFEELIQFLQSAEVARVRARLLAGEDRLENLAELRRLCEELPDGARLTKAFLLALNREVVSAKAMFLAYSDPFEKKRALLFEYAHTLGHGVEAVLNGLYAECARRGLSVPEDAVKFHGAYVGMAVLWAGQMSADQGLLEGAGLAAHQAFVLLFNAFGGFSFAPLRSLCEQLEVSRDEFVERVLQVVRRDNKRGYVTSAGQRSVDQLVMGRPGKMVRSADPEAELRYLVEVDEAWQRRVLERAFALDFDLVCDAAGAELCFTREQRRSPCAHVAACVRHQLQLLTAPPKGLCGDYKPLRRGAAHPSGHSLAGASTDDGLSDSQDDLRSPSPDLRSPSEEADACVA